MPQKLLFPLIVKMSAQVGASNVTSNQPTNRQLLSMDFVKSSPVFVDANNLGTEIKIEDLFTAFQRKKGMVLRGNPDTLFDGYNYFIYAILPPTENLLEMFAKLQNRPLIDGDTFYLTFTPKLLPLTTNGGNGIYVRFMNVDDNFLPANQNNGLTSATNLRFTVDLVNRQIILYFIGENF